MKTGLYWLSFVLFSALLMTGCTVQVPVSVQVSPAPAEAGCPTPTPGQVLARNDAAGYCFSIPSGFEAEVFSETDGSLVRAPVTSEGHRERLLIYVEPTLGRSLAQVTEQTLANYAIPGIEVEVSSDATVGGEPAAIITGLTGQDPNRRVIVVHGGRIYAMMFVPDHPNMGQAYQEMEALFTAVMSSFAFIPATAPVGWALPGGQEDGYPADPALTWVQRVYGDGGSILDCHRLSVAADGTTWAGTCAQVDVMEKNAPFQWGEIRTRFAPFVYRGGNWDLLFQGEGDVYHPLWVQALDAWAQVTYGEIVNGRTSATARTGLSWWLGPAEGEIGLCRHLVVLSHGYAYANLDPCAGGFAQTVAEGWLQTAEIETFGLWLYSGAPVYVEDSYLDGMGEQELSPAEVEQLEQWALEVYQRLQSE